MDNLEAKRIGKEEEILSKMKERKNEIEKRKLNGGKSQKSLVKEVGQKRALQDVSKRVLEIRYKRKRKVEQCDDEKVLRLEDEENLKKKKTR